jgi:putative endonuclease
MKSEIEQKHQRWIVYILRCSDGSFYTGTTNGLEKRLISHNRGTASKYTRSRRPVTLLSTSLEMSRSEALRLEMKIKKLPKTKKIAFLTRTDVINKA